MQAADDGSLGQAIRDHKKDARKHGLAEDALLTDEDKRQLETGSLTVADLRRIRSVTEDRGARDSFLVHRVWRHGK